MRELLVIIGVVLIALILWDGLRRMKQRKGRYQGGYTQDPEELRKQAQIKRELPNGGARVRPMSDRDKTDLNTRLNLRERVPMLMDPIEEDNEASDTTAEDSDAEQQALDFDSPLPASGEDHAERGDDRTAAVHFSARDNDARGAAQPHESAPATAEAQARPDTPKPNDEDDVEPEETAPERDSEPAVTGDTGEPDTDPDNDLEPGYQADDRPVEELVVIHVMAPESGSIAGSELLELLLRAGLRFGPMDIFHYRNGRGQLEFSLANCVQPGTLNPDSMAEFTTPGVTLFMQLPQHADMMTSFDHMLEMADFLAKHLDAEMLDEEHSSVTPQRVEHYRERLRNFARSQLIQAHE